MKPPRTASSSCSHWPLPVLIGIFASTLCGQESRTVQTGDAVLGLPEFEVASVKPTDLSGDVLVGTQVYPGGRVRISGCELTGLIRVAYQLSYQEISGGADWTNRVKYDVEAVPAEAAAIRDIRQGSFRIADERLRQMLQALLRTRFQLQFHRETRMGKVYLLKLASKRPALHSTNVDLRRREPRMGGSISGNGATAAAVTVLPANGCWKLQRWRMWRGTRPRMLWAALQSWTERG
jgi:uncharacterized protein (TIGR03435 family)